MSGFTNKIHTIMFAIMTAAILMLLTAPLQLQTAYADLISASPENIVTASGQVSWNHFWNDHSHNEHFHLSLLRFITHHRGHCHYTSSTSASSFLTNDYELNVKSLKDYNVNVASGSGLGGTTLTLTDADTTATTILTVGNNPITPVSKGTATISITSTNLGTTQLNDALFAHTHTAGPPFFAGHFHGSCFDDHSHAATVTQDFTLTVTQPNAGGPKPRLAQDSGANLLGFSSITQLIDIPAKGLELEVSVPGATTSCEVFDQHGASRGLCGTHALSSGDYSGLWSIVADGPGTTTMSASVDGTDLELLTEVTK